MLRYYGLAACCWLIGDVFSLVASKPDEPMQPEQGYSYHIQPGPPLGRSYAEHIAAQYGISDEQLQALIETRFSADQQHKN